MKELTEIEIEEARMMFDGINDAGRSYFLGFMAALISTARKNDQPHIAIKQIELAIDLAKMQPETDTYRILIRDKLEMRNWADQRQDAFDQKSCFY